MDRKYLRFSVDGQIITRKDNLPVVGGTQNYLYAEFDLSEEWNGLHQTAVFSSNSGRHIGVVIENGQCAVPWEVLRGTEFWVGVFAGERITSNTVRVPVMTAVKTNATPGVQPTPSAYEMLVKRTEEALSKVPTMGENGHWFVWNAANGAYEDSGVYAGGTAPYIGPNGTWIVGDRDTGVSATGPAGPTGPQGPQGPKGEDGTMTFEELTDEQKELLRGPQGIPGEKGEKGDTGATGATGPQGPKGDTGNTGPSGKDGEDGQDGEDGYSPTVKVSTISGGHRVTITDATGTRYFDVMDGKDGAGGSGGSGTDGKDGVTFYPNVDSSGNLSWTNDGGLTNPDTVNLKGPKGDTGATGATGATGPQGPQGPTGATGSQGPKGDPGATGPQGPQGADGDDGYTPVRGTDYWTAADIAEIKSYVDEAVLGGAW